MSLFSTCITCNEVAQHVCKCSDSPRLLCDTHAITHIKSQGEHNIQTALDTLSFQEMDSLQRAFKTVQDSFIREALSRRNAIIDHYLREIRRVEEECSSLIEGILNRPIKREIDEVISRGSLPLFSQSPFAQSLLFLKQSQMLSEENILEYLRSLLPSPKSYLDQIYSTQSSNLQTSLKTAISTQNSSKPSLSLQTIPSSFYIPQAFVAEVPKWEVLKQKNKAHGDNICSIAISDCEKYLASGSQDKKIKIWNLRTLDLIRTLRGHKKTVRSVSFLGDKVVSGSADNTIKIWDGDRCTETLNLHSNFVTSVCVSSCKRLIVSGSSDKTVVVYSLERNNTVHTLTGHSDYVLSVALSSSNQEIVSGSCDKTIKLWKTDTGELLKTLNGHSELVTCVTFYGEHILSSSRDRTVRMWNRNTGEAVVNLGEHTSQVTSVDAKNDLIISLGIDNRIILWNARTGKVIQNLEGHGNYDSALCMSVKFTDGARFIVSGGPDKSIKLLEKIK